MPLPLPSSGCHSLTPITVAYDEATDTVTILGIAYSGALFRVLAWPRTDRLYRFVRDDAGTVTVYDCGDAFPLHDPLIHSH